jgi:hypothetical protein
MDVSTDGSLEECFMCIYPLTAPNQVSTDWKDVAFWLTADT